MALGAWTPGLAGCPAPSESCSRSLQRSPRRYPRPGFLLILGKWLLLVPFGEGGGGPTHDNSSTASLEPPREKQQWPVAPSKPMVTHSSGCHLQAGQPLRAARSTGIRGERQRHPGPSPSYRNPHPNISPQAHPHFEGSPPTGTKLPLIASPHNLRLHCFQHLLCS